VIFDLQHKIAGLPGSTPVRKELIANVIGYVDGLAKEAAGDPGLQQELAESYMEIGDVQGGGNENLGDLKGALASFQKAEQIARALTAAAPSFDSRKLLVEALRAVGRVYNQSNDRARAETYRRETLAMAGELQKEYPGNEDAKSLMAYSLFDMATLTGDSKSLEYLLRALPIYEELLKAKPSDATRQRNAALTHKSIASYWLSADFTQALPYLKRALALDEARLVNEPGDQRAELDLSVDYSQFSTYYYAKHDLPTAIEYQGKALAIRRELAASDPKDVWKQNRLAMSLNNTANYLYEKDHDRAALADLEESKRIIERLGLSDRGDIAVYARTLLLIGLLNRDMKHEKAACEQFSKAREFYLNLGPSTVNSTQVAALDDELATCRP
jgi:tetratricopeptide (TPR) repeat protein